MTQIIANPMSPEDKYIYELKLQMGALIDAMEPLLKSPDVKPKDKLTAQASREAAIKLLRRYK